jgi:signal transduction histidine kinase/HAMP domain-containing protein
LRRQGNERTRTPPLARLKVGTKLMLLVLLPVCVLLGFTSLTALADWHAAGQLQAFRAASRLSFATAGVAGHLATERTAAALVRLRPGAQAQAGLGAAQRGVNQALHQAQDSAADWNGTVDVAGRLATARERLAALRHQVAGGSLSVPDISTSYGARVNDLISTVGDLIEAQPPQNSGQAPEAYLAILQAVEAAQRERVDVAAALGAPRDQMALDQATATSRWTTLEGAELGTFRQNAPERLNTDLDAVLRTPAAIAVRNVRAGILARPRTTVTRTSLGAWLDATGTRIGGLGRLESGTARDLATTAAGDLHAARAGGLRNLGLSLAVLSVVTALGLVLRRSITRPLSEVSEGARTLSGGDLAFDVSYAGRDEIGDVAAAFRDLHVTAERLAGEIRATNAAIGDNRLDHRADVSAFEGTWTQLLAGMNDTTAAFARMHQEQAALRRVATLVAERVAPAELFDAVVAEMHLLLGAENTRLLRYEPDHTVTVVAARSGAAGNRPGTRYSLEGESVSAAVWRTGRPARLDHFGGPPGSAAEVLIRMGIRSAAGAPILVENRLWGVMVAAWTRHQPVSGIEDRIAQFTDLVAIAISDAQARADLAASRARVVAASDQTRRRIERDLHDGAQQRLVSLGLGLRAAQKAVPPGQPGLRQELARLARGTAEILEELREMSRGIHPAILSLGGLGPALKALARRSPVPVQLDVRVQARLPERAEVAAYFVVSEALANVAKHARASVVQVQVEVRDGALTVSIRDDGVGGADPSRGSGLIGLTDRVEASGGTISISSHAGAGTQITAELPVSAS